VEQHLDEIQRQIEGLTRELCEVKQRLETLEARGRAASDTAPEQAPAQAAGDVSDAGATPLMTPARTIPLIGRTLVILGGAYLLRALTSSVLTDSALLPPAGGAVAGLLYAAWWLVQADRSAAAGRRQSAVFLGLATALIAYPLIWETTARLEFLGASAAAAALFVLLLLGLAVARRRELWEIVWTITLFTVATSLALIVVTHEFMPLTTTLLLASVAVEILAYHDRFLGLRWPVALGADLAVLILTSAALVPGRSAETGDALALGGVVAVCTALPLLYLGSISARTLLRGRPISAFEVTQAGVALLIGFTGAVRVTIARGADPAFVGIVGLVLGAACYAAALTFIDRRLGRGRNFYSYTTLAGLLVLAGSWLMLDSVALALTWSALAVAATGLGGRFDRITLKFHGAVYVAAAATAAGLVVCAYRGLFAEPTGIWEPPKAVGIVVTLVAAACYAILAATRGEAVRRWFELLPQAIVGAAAVWSVAGLTAGVLSAPITAAFGADAAAPLVAASRTAVIVILAMALAGASRRWSLRELTWFVYPVLVAGGIKLIFEDFDYDQPVALFLALALYGSALIATPRLMRKNP